MIVSLFFVQAALAMPEKLADLPGDMLARIAKEATVRVDLADYELRSFQNTVGEHGIATYEAFEKDAGCEEGNRYYISLYVEGSKLKFVTSFVNFGCHQD